VRCTVLYSEKRVSEIDDGERREATYNSRSRSPVRPKFDDLAIEGSLLDAAVAGLIAGVVLAIGTALGEELLDRMVEADDVVVAGVDCELKESAYI
jgi:hypothetical protein